MTAWRRRLVPLLFTYLVVLFALALRPAIATNVQSLNLVPFSSIERDPPAGSPLFAINIVETSWCLCHVACCFHTFIVVFGRG